MDVTMKITCICHEPGDDSSYEAVLAAASDRRARLGNPRFHYTIINPTDSTRLMARTVAGDASITMFDAPELSEGASADQVCDAVLRTIFSTQLPYPNKEILVVAPARALLALGAGMHREEAAKLRGFSPAQGQGFSVFIGDSTFRIEILSG